MVKKKGKKLYLRELKEKTKKLLHLFCGTFVRYVLLLLILNCWSVLHVYIKGYTDFFPFQLSDWIISVNDHHHQSNYETATLLWLL